MLVLSGSPWKRSATTIGACFSASSTRGPRVNVPFTTAYSVSTPSGSGDENSVAAKRVVFLIWSI